MSEFANFVFGFGVWGSADPSGVFSASRPKWSDRSDRGSEPRPHLRRDGGGVVSRKSRRWNSRVYD